MTSDLVGKFEVQDGVAEIDLYNLIQEFQLQLRHEPIFIEANGFFKIDLTLLFKVYSFFLFIVRFYPETKYMRLLPFSASSSGCWIFIYFNSISTSRKYAEPD